MDFARSRFLHLFRKILRAGFYAGIGTLLTLVTVYVKHLNGRADLDLWHLVELDQEFTADSQVSTFDDYLALEDRLFRQLDEQVYAKLGSDNTDGINRFKRGSLADPERWSPNWNRSFIQPVIKPRAAVLLIHGMSDSPYSLRKMGESLHASGAYVLGLRIPGHGTVPAGLVNVTWQDMAAAVRLAVQHLAKQSGSSHIYIVGYSNGAALAINYALTAIEDPELPRIERLALLSPEIGLSPVAALALWQARLGRLLGLDKLNWNSLLPEYDPFKYGSFAVNAGDVAYRMTQQVQLGLSALTESGKLGDIPPILAFSSAVDATVSTPDLVDGLFNRLPEGGHELVLFDVNHHADMNSIFKWDPAAMTRAIDEKPGRNYTLTLVSNQKLRGEEVFAHSKRPGHTADTDYSLELVWPKDIYSLAHVALPFSPGDPLYGGFPEQQSPGISIGNLALRGERGALQIPASEMLRLRWNPFYPYLEDKVLEFLNLDPAN